jgi:hypothetical protein
MSFNPLSPEAQVYSYLNNKNYGIDVKETMASGTVLANITLKNPKGNHGFSFDLKFKAVFSDTIELSDLSASQASTWSDRSSKSDSIDYHLGCKDIELLTPAVIEAIKSKIEADSINTTLPASFFEPANETKACDTTDKIVEHLAIDFESDIYDIQVTDEDTAHGCVHILVDGNLNYIVDFKATYDTEYKRASFSDGVMISPRVNRAININVSDLKYTEFARFDGELSDDDKKVSSSDAKTIKELISREIAKTHEKLKG